MKERPILFSGAMVRAILEGRKTQTRRVFREPERLSDGWAWKWDDAHGELYGEFLEPTDSPDCLVPYRDQTGISVRCPYGQPGDRLWVRETWKPVDWGRVPGMRQDIEYGATGTKRDCVYGNSLPATYAPCDFLRWRPSIHMPRWASRLTLEVVAVRVERVQDISEPDAIAEGAAILSEHDGKWYSHGGDKNAYACARQSFWTIWDSINAARGYGWAVNPWTWVISFKRVQP